MNPSPADRVRAATAEEAEVPRRAEIRELEGPEEFRQCLELQRATWGRDFTELVPLSLLALTQKNGGVVAGAFDGDDLVGFVLGFTGLRDGGVAHWSHMLAVRSSARGRGLGLRLKLFQRSLLLQRDIGVVFWTYDPLVSRNAHLNLNRLGAEVVEFVEDMYGSDTNSRLHGGTGTDRFLVRWDLRGPRARAAIRRRIPSELDPARGALPVLEAGDGGEPRASEAPDGEDLLVEVPADFTALVDGSPDGARRWRRATRRAFGHRLGRGYRVVAFGRRAGDGDPRYAYLLEAPEG